MGGKGPDTQTTVSKNEPPEFVRPYIEDALASAQNLYQTRPMYSSTEIPGLTQQGFDLGAETAQNPALLDPATQYARGAIGGEYLGADALRNAAMSTLDDVIGGTRGRFAAAGRTGSGLENYALGRGVTAALSEPYMRERQMQQQAALTAPGLEQARYLPAQQMINLGQQQRALEDKYYAEPWQRLQQYTSTALGGAPAMLAGGTQTSERPIYQPSPWQQIGGLALGLGGLFM